MLNNSLNIRAIEGQVTGVSSSDDPVGMFVKLHRSDEAFILPSDTDPRREEIVRNLDQIAILIRAKQQSGWRS